MYHQLGQKENEFGQKGEWYAHQADEIVEEEEERTRGEETSSTIVVGGYCCSGAVSGHWSIYIYNISKIHR